MTEPSISTGVSPVSNGSSFGIAFWRTASPGFCPPAMPSVTAVNAIGVLGGRGGETVTKPTCSASPSK